MRGLRYLPTGQPQQFDFLEPLIEDLNRQREILARVPVQAILALLDNFSHRIIRDRKTQDIEGVAFLSAWLRSSNLEKVLRLNVGESLECLDGFISVGAAKIAAKPRGLVSMWMAGNVPTLPLFSIVPALLAKNACLVKLAYPDPRGLDALLTLLAQSSADGLEGKDLIRNIAVVWFDYAEHDLNETMSMAADTRMVWGGSQAVRAISVLPHQEHCTEIVFGPKYSIGLIDRTQLESPEGLEQLIMKFVRDIAAFDQRACSSPQTIFVERNSRLSLRQVGELFATHLAHLPPKPGLDPYTTVGIMNARSEWALDAGRDVIVSGPEANWTVCMDREVSLKEAVQSRTVFLTEIASWREILPLLGPRIQTAGIAFGVLEDAESFAEEATTRGVARCVRPGFMNAFESPWDGKLVISELVRWVMFKP